MRFNVGEVWTSIDPTGAGEPRRAVVTRTEDDNRRGTLFFDDGEEQSFQWSELTQAGQWHVNTSPKPTRSADELKALILRKMQSHPVCPAGMSLEIEPASGSDWRFLAVPPPGQSIAYADCVDYMNRVARALRSLYGLSTSSKSTPVDLPSIGWMNSGNDAADIAVRTAADRQRLFIAATSQSGITEPFASSSPVPPVLSASTAPSTVQLEARSSAQAKGSADMSVHRAGVESTATTIAVVQRKLTEQPSDIREAARSLSAAIAEQIAELNATKPNDAHRLAQQEDFIRFLESIAGGLDDLAELIDQAIAAGSADKPEPVLLGKAGEIASKLSEAISEGLERNRTYIVDCSIKFCVFATGFTFLHLIGVNESLAAIIAGLMNFKLPSGDSKK